MSDASKTSGVKANLKLRFSANGFLKSWEIEVEDRSLPTTPQMPLCLTIESNGQEIQVSGDFFLVNLASEFENFGETSRKIVHVLVLEGDLEIATAYPFLSLQWDGRRVSVIEI